MDTQGFAEAVAPWADYGEHVVHDGGACQIGLGVAIVAVLLWQEAIGAVLAGFTAGMLLHALSRLVDGDTPVAVLLAVVGVLGAVALVLRVRELTHRRGPVGSERPGGVQGWDPGACEGFQGGHRIIREAVAGPIVRDRSRPGRHNRADVSYSCVSRSAGPRRPDVGQGVHGEVEIGFSILLILSSIVLVLLILLHKGRGGGLSDLFGGGATSNLGGSSVAERNLDRITVGAGIIWFACIVALGLLYKAG